jgi:hypothetical protein
MLLNTGGVGNMGAGDGLASYRFNVVTWELSNLPGVLSVQANGDSIASEIVLRYFTLSEQGATLKSEIQRARDTSASGDLSGLTARLEEIIKDKDTLEPAVRETLIQQIEATLRAENIYASLGRQKFHLPPVRFSLTVPPHVLAISPVDRIAIQETVILRQDLSSEEINTIESRADGKGVSSVVLELGGFGGTYPTFVVNDSSLRFTVETAIHEWLHQYLAFKPLGFRYVLSLLGIRSNPEIAAMNETLADMVSKELAASLLQRYYAGYDKNEGQLPPEDGFDFDREMRNARQTVDAYLARGEIQQAEQFMEWEREYLLSNGYYIRKLNQAYFAFNDMYADSPASVNPIGDEMALLRKESASLSNFLARVSRMTSRAELTRVSN